MKLSTTKVNSSKIFSSENVARTIYDRLSACVLRFSIPALILISLFCISFQPALASSVEEQVNTTVVADLNQSAGKDIISLVDTGRFEINANPIFNVIWSPDGNKMLIDASLFLHIKGGGDFGSGRISALYLADANGSEIKRVAWGESTSSEGKSIRSPAWSQSGDYFAYVEESTGPMYREISSQLVIMSDDLQPVHKVDQETNISGVITDPVLMPVSFKWSPAEDKIITFIPGNLVVYDLEKNTNFSFDIGNNYHYINDIGLSGDGNKVSFSIATSNNEEIIVADIEKRVLDRIYSADRAGMYAAKWSPDSKKLVFYEISGSEKDATLRYDVYVKDEDAGKPVKIATFDSGSSRIIQWYPDSERLLAKRCIGDTDELYSLSLSGDIDELITGDNSLDGKVCENGCVLATSLNSSSKTPSYIRSYDLFLLNGSDQLTIANVPYYRLESDDLIFISDANVSVLNTVTNETWRISIPTENPERVSLHPSGSFIAVDNYIMGIQGPSDQMYSSIGNKTDNSISGTAATKTGIAETSEIESKGSTVTLFEKVTLLIIKVCVRLFSA